MKRLLLALTALLIALPASAANRYVAASLAWNDATTVHANGTGAWNDDGCGQAADASAVPTAADAVFLCPDVTVTVPCNYDVVLLSLDDSGTWTSASTGGLNADGSACAAGEVPTFTFSQTSSAGAVVLDAMGASATYVMKGRSVITDSPWGEPSDLTHNCGGSNQTINANDGNTTGVVYATATNDCSQFTWANLPYSASKPTLTSLSKGDMVWFTTGQYRNNFVTVVAADANTVTLGFGDPGSTYGGGLAGWDGPAQLPTIGGNGNKRSLENYIDVDMTAVDQTVPTRILVSIQTGALSLIPTGTSATGQRAGQCLITSTQTATAGSGTYYRIAGSIDGGGGTDTLILDPWVTMAAADTAAAFLATAGNAWVGPCVRPGDRWYAFEPIVVKPATAGTHYTSHVFINGACPSFQRAWFPMATPANDPAGSTSDLSQPFMGFAGQRGCTMVGPLAVGPYRHAGTAGYGIMFKDAHDTTMRDVSMQGQWFTGAQNWKMHGFAYIDVSNLVLDRTNVSFINNNAYYLPTLLEETSEADSTFEGATVTVSNSTAHDIWDAVSSTDLGGFLTFRANQTVGTFSLTAHDNIAWNIELHMLAAETTPPDDFTLTLHSNVLGPTHRIDEADSSERYALGCQIAQPTHNIANNVLLSDIDYNAATSGSTSQILNCESAIYNYIGEATNGFLVGSTTHAEAESLTVHGNLIEGAGASSVGVSTSSTFLRGVDVNRGTGLETLAIKQNLLRRFCPISTVISFGINVLSASAANPVELAVENNSFGLYCPEITGVGNTPTAGTSGLQFQNANALSNLVPGNIRNNLFITGDLTHDAGADNYEVYPLICNPAATTAPGATVGKNVCSECAVSPCGHTCARSCNLATLVNITHEASSVDTSILSPARRMEATGIRGITDLRLRRESPAFAFDEDAPVGSHYAGIVSYRQAMQDADIPQEFLFQRATDGLQPDRSVLPSELRFLISTGGGGRTILPDHY